jgi:hypothetical protein
MVLCFLGRLSKSYISTSNSRYQSITRYSTIRLQRKSCTSKDYWICELKINLNKRIPWRLQSALSNDVTTVTNQQQEAQQQQRQRKTRRMLGSQELLMLPRQYGVSNDVSFPSMNHVSCTILNATPSNEVLLQSVQYVMQQHPLLYAYVDGDGEPTKRIDLFQMVRNQDDDEPYPLMFVADNPNRYDASNDIVSFIQSNNIEQSWQSSFRRDLDDGSWCNIKKGPLWKIEVHQSKGDSKDSPCALLMSFNHAISDQSSANRIVDQILRTIDEFERGILSNATSKPMQQSMPLSLEESVLGVEEAWKDVKAKGVSIQTLKYIVDKATEGFNSPVILPESSAASDNNPLVGAMTIISGREAGGRDSTNKLRKSNVQFRTLSAETTSALLSKCKQNGVSVSNALTAVVTYTTSDFIGQDKKRYYKILQSLDMRRFGAKLDKGETVACMAGSHDLLHGPINDGSGRALITNPSKTKLDGLWNLAVKSKQQTESFLYDSVGPKEAVRVFDFAMTISDLNNLVYLSSKSHDTKGRAYSAGITNVGVYDKLSAFTDTSTDQKGRTMIQRQHGQYKVKQVFYATPHTQSGCLFPVSCMTVNGQLQLTFNPVDPIISDEISSNFADAFVEVLQTISGEIMKGAIIQEEEDNLLSKLPTNALPLLASVIGSIAVASHGGAWIQFFNSVMEMKANIADPADFWAALNFWIFFAVGHPLLPPVLWISDVLHGSPGPKLADIVPITFLAGNAIAIGAIALSKEVRVSYQY